MNHLNLPHVRYTWIRYVDNRTARRYLLWEGSVSKNLKERTFNKRQSENLWRHERSYRDNTKITSFKRRIIHPIQNLETRLEHATCRVRKEMEKWKRSLK